MKVLGIVGSLRRDSWNRKLWRVARRALEQQGAEAEELDLAPVPFYNADVHALGFPPAVVALREAIQRADALVFAAPVYNDSVPGVLKNAIDWASRKPNAFSGKVAFIMGVSDGQNTPAPMHMHLSYILEHVGVWVVSLPRVLLANAEKQFTPDGKLADPAVADVLAQAMSKLVETARRMAMKD